MKNILLITVDEMRGDCAGFMGNPDVKTPHLDALARQGTVFENHFAPFPKCVPSRCSMHTGRYPHTDGLRSVMMDNHIRQDQPTLASFLRSQGYETAILGLNHIWHEDDFYGHGEAYRKPGGGVVDYTSFTDGPLVDIALTERKYPAGTARKSDAVSALSHLGFNGLTQGRITDFSDENRADQAKLYLREIRSNEKPFFLQLNLSKPHPSYQIHEPYYSQYHPDSITPFPGDLPSQAPLPLQAQREWRTGLNLPKQTTAEIQAVYYGMISFVDDLVGGVLAELDEQGLREDTLIIFCSDHGDYAGQYGLVEKWDASLQDCLLHVPFILSGPDIPSGERTNSFSEMVDIPATVLDYLNLQKPEEWVWHGQSLLPATRGESTKQAVFASGGHEEAMRSRFNAPVWKEKNGQWVLANEGKQLVYQKCPDAMARCKMVRTQQWKLVIRETGGNELYDLKSDPYEMNNEYGNPSYDSITSQLMLMLIEWGLRTDQDRPYLASFGA
tara:strand:+ start:1852 stop:3351 length:1500 start_codon:yes stop_codon:yes gene_type:complete